MAADLDAQKTLICLHCLGGSARSWDAVSACVASPAHIVAIDLPGFGDAVDLPAEDVSGMADAVASRVKTLAPRRWALAGHSMGGKIASVVARRAEDGEPGLDGLAAIILLAGSPPGEEPMDAAKRREMLAWVAGDTAPLMADAQRFIDQNISAALSPRAYAQAVDDVMRMNPAAWRRWLEHGSREDLSDRVGLLRTPALIVAGGDDAALGPDAQRTLNGPHFADARFVVIPRAKHLLPLEAPGQVAALIAEHIG